MIFYHISSKKLKPIRSPIVLPLCFSREKKPRSFTQQTYQGRAHLTETTKGALKCMKIGKGHANQAYSPLLAKEREILWCPGGCLATVTSVRLRAGTTEEER